MKSKRFSKKGNSYKKRPHSGPKKGTQKYKKTFDYSYSIGVYPTLELIQTQPGRLFKVIVSSKGSSNSGLRKITEFCRYKNIPVENNNSLLHKITGNENSYVVGFFHKYEKPINVTSNHVVLVNPDDAGNFGTIVRTMLSFGYSDLVVIRPAVDIFDPKVVRASMGAAFSVNYQYFYSLDEYLDSLKQHRDKRALYTLVSKGGTHLTKLKFEKPHSLIFGSEPSGLNDNVASVGTKVSIPQSAHVDSLNLSVAAGIVLYSSTLN